MATVDDLDKVIEQYQFAQSEIVKGNVEPQKKVCSHREDAGLANPLGPPARGWEQEVAEARRISYQRWGGRRLRDRSGVRDS